MNQNAPVVLLGLDAAEVTLIERLCSEGKLPALQSLRKQGCFGSLESEGVIFSGGVWPTFYTSQRVPWHGIYHDILWRSDRMRFETLDDRWLTEEPFWEVLDPSYRIALIDVPMVLRSPGSMNGVAVAGWGSHDRVWSGSSPPELWAQLKRELGAPVMSRRLARPRTAAELLRFKESLLETTDQMMRLAKALLRREAWDLFVMVLGATHRGGHHLWDLSQIDERGLLAGDFALRTGLEEVYVSCDKALARLLEDAPKNARILVFAVHGMGPNPGWNDRCGDVLSRIQPGGRHDGLARTGPFARLRKLAPPRLRASLYARLPGRVRNHVINRRLTEAFDWTATRFFPLAMDHAGYFRVNLKGRESRGIVDPGGEYHSLCDELEAVFLDLRDVDTNEAIVDKVYRVGDLAPPEAPRRDLLPDLLMTWRGPSAVHSKGVYSQRCGEIRWNSNGKLPSLRSGNHREKGWFVAVGEGIEPATRADGHHVVDLVPTLFQWMGAAPARNFQGKPIPSLTGS